MSALAITDAVTDALPAETCEAIAGLPIAAPAIADTGGKRDTHNDSRTFFSAENRGRCPVCDAVAGAFQDPATVRALAATCRVAPGGGLLRLADFQVPGGQATPAPWPPTATGCRPGGMWPTRRPSRRGRGMFARK